MHAIAAYADSALSMITVCGHDALRGVQCTARSILLAMGVGPLVGSCLSAGGGRLLIGERVGWVAPLVGWCLSAGGRRLLIVVRGARQVRWLLLSGQSRGVSVTDGCARGRGSCGVQRRAAARRRLPGPMLASLRS